MNDLRHGYTLDDLHGIARAAVSADRLMASDVKDRYDTAWSAIAEHLYAAEEPPGRQQLVRIGWQAIYQAVRDMRRDRGYSDGYNNYDGTGPDRPRFLLFWGPQVTPSHEDRVVEREATRQIMATLTNPTYRDAVLALAVHGDYQQAADALGISYKALTARLVVARRQAIGLWHEGETPHRSRHPDRRVEKYGATLATHCSAGHEWTPENTRVAHHVRNGRRHSARRCRACERDRAVARRGARKAVRNLAALAAEPALEHAPTLFDDSETEPAVTPDGRVPSQAAITAMPAEVASA